MTKMPDLTIGQLPASTSVSDEALFVIEQNGEAQSVTGGQWKAYAQSSVAQYVQTAQNAAESAQNASESAQSAAQNASESAGVAQESANAAASAKNAIENMSVSAETLPPGSQAAVSKTAVGGSFNLLFGIPRGQQGETGPQGPQGIQGPQGPQGINGVAVAATGQYAFNVDSNGHLILYYEGDTAPDFSIGDDGHLYFNFEEATANATT